MTERFPDPAHEPEGRAEDLEGTGIEGGHAAAGESEGERQTLDGASGGYGSRSGVSSGGSGDGEAGTGGRPLPTGMGDGTTSSATGATGYAPTEWLRDADGRRPPENS